MRKDNQPSSTYQIKTDADFYRVGKTSSNKNFIDLDGGPMIYLGDILVSSDGKEHFYLASIVFNDDKFYELRFQKK